MIVQSRSYHIYIKCRICPSGQDGESAVTKLRALGRRIESRHQGLVYTVHCILYYDVILQVSLLDGNHLRSRYLC